MKNNYIEDWKSKYEKYKKMINFTAGDFESFKEVMKEYVVQNNPEGYNDWQESSEVSMFVNATAYLGENISYRVDLNYHDLFPSTTERKEVLLNFGRMLSYESKRNIGAKGIAKITSISTSEELTDTLGNELKNIEIYWNDATNKNWKEQFLTILNSAFIINNQYGKPLKKVNNSGITTQLYEVNSKKGNGIVSTFTSKINTVIRNFDVVNPDIDLSTGELFERQPQNENQFHMVYRTDGSGYSSVNTGFFVYWKQGVLKNKKYKFDTNIENNYIDISDDNVNQEDVWFQEIDESNSVITEWNKLDSSEYLSYSDNEDKNIFKVETKENDNIRLVFSDNVFGNVPYGLYRVWYRVSDGNELLYIKPSDIQNVKISIPYQSKSSNNVFYLNMSFSIVSPSHINQGVEQESVDNIKENMPLVYSTQQRMVTSQDYNYFPKKYGQEIKIINAINRTYAGNSRYVDFNDPTGMYKSANIIGTDGYVYSELSVKSEEVSIDDETAEMIYNKHILPIISSISTQNLYYQYYNSYKVPNVIDYHYNWETTNYLDNKVTIGYLRKSNDNSIVSYNELYLQVGDMVCFVNDKNEKKWVKIIKIDKREVDGTSEDEAIDYSIYLNEVLSLESNWSIRWEDGVSKYVKLDKNLDELKDKILEKLSLVNDLNARFGLTYIVDKDSGNWVIETDEDDANWLDYLDKDYTDNELYTQDGGEFLPWIIRITYQSGKVWKIESKHHDYIFGSNGEVSFFFSENQINRNDIQTNDIVSFITSQNEWKPISVYESENGYINRQIIGITSYDSNKDSIIDNPEQYSDFIGNSDETIIILNNEIIDVKNIKNMWGYTGKNGYYYVDDIGDIIPAHKTFGSIFIDNALAEYDDKVIYTEPNKEYVLSDGSITKFEDGITISKSIDRSYDVVVTAEYNSIVPRRSGLVYWDAKKKELTLFDENQYKKVYGKKNIKFLWKHYPIADYVINPSTTNIIDVYVITQQYYNSVKKWLETKTGFFPKVETTYELSQIFKKLNKNKMISDELVWHSVSYKLLFGSEAKSDLRGTLNVVKNVNSTMSETEIKQNVIKYVDEYFTNMGVGETFYYTQLSTYIHNRMPNDVDTVVPISAYEKNKFGELFQVSCDTNNILLSCATLSDVKIIKEISDILTK